MKHRNVFASSSFGSALPGPLQQNKLLAFAFPCLHRVCSRSRRIPMHCQEGFAALLCQLAVRHRQVPPDHDHNLEPFAFSRWHYLTLQRLHDRGKGQRRRVGGSPPFANAVQDGLRLARSIVRKRQGSPDFCEAALSGILLWKENTPKDTTTRVARSPSEEIPDPWWSSPVVSTPCLLLLLRLEDGPCLARHPRRHQAQRLHRRAHPVDPGRR
mmetsp:Transcript_4192/g.16312  ORF Transcript_4192/g.16312 Transcript_4192/m.16312 type:complete len:213 (+) Transcript_4192:2298-2936(+)